MDRRVVVVLLGLAIVAAAAAGAGWMYLHLTCPRCQDRWAALRRAVGRRLIE